MFIVLFVLFLLMIVIGLIFIHTELDSMTFIGVSGCVVGAIAECILLFFVTSSCIDVSKSMIIDDKIKMYNKENQNIEKEMTEIVTSYKEYEKETISNVGEMATVLIRFPELKSNELVKKQMDVYVCNNDKIKELKEEKLEYSVARWWLYFGK